VQDFVDDAVRELGREALISFADLVSEINMLRPDLENARRDALCKSYGFRALDYHRMTRRTGSGQETKEGKQMTEAMAPEARVYVAGHRGMVGSALVRCLQAAGYKRLLLRTSSELDLTDQAAVWDFFAAEKPQYVFLAAAKVGGIHANSSYPAEFIYQNLAIETNVIEAAFKARVQRLIFLGSSCIYPRKAQQPMAESVLLTGLLEPSNEPYAIAKIAGIKLCESYNRQYGTDFRSVMPTNLYGINDNFHPKNSHVIPGMMRRFHEAKLAQAPEAVVWGTGHARREFLYVDDMASACLHVMNLAPDAYAEVTQPMLSHINIGTGVDLSISELAETMAGVVGFKGRVVFDPSKPDGTPRKLLDVRLLHKLGWKACTSLQNGLEITYRWFKDSEGRG